jgi:hypothetical protein
MESILFSNPNCISYSIFNITNQETKNFNVINQIFFYLSLSFYHLGICYENQGFPYPSYYAYKQCKFFISIIKDRSEDMNKFYEFIIEIEKRQLLRNRIIIFFDKFVKKEDLIDEEPPEKKVEQNILNSKREMRAKKFQKLENFISNMKLLDADHEEPHLFDKINKHFKYNVKIATKQIHLLNYLMSDNFKETIKKMDKIRINKLDKETINIIQKKIISIKNNEREKLSLKLKNEKKSKNIKNSKSTEKVIKEKDKINFKTIRTISSAKTFFSGVKTRVSSSYKNSNILATDINNNNSIKTESVYTFNSRPTTAHNDLSYKSTWHKYFSYKNMPERNKYMNLKTQSHKNMFIKGNKLLISSSTKNIKNNKLKYKVPKYSYDKYLFNKSFMKKRKILDNQYFNELLFQKQLLKFKNHKYLDTNTFNINQIHKDCEQFYVRTLEKELMFVKERNNIFGKKAKKLQKKEKSNKSFLNIKRMKSKNLNNYINNDKSEYDYETLNKNNFDYIDKIFGDIVDLNHKEKKIKKRYGKSK